jgi:hypothetical protein
MNNFEFVSYEPTPTEPKTLGIATIRAWGKIILRYKIVPGKDGHGWFTAISSMKKSPDEFGKDQYTQSFLIDSNFDVEQIKQLIKHHVSPYEQKTNTPAPQRQNTPANSQTHQPWQQNTPAPNMSVSGNPTWPMGNQVYNQQPQPQQQFFQQAGQFQQPRNPPVTQPLVSDEVPF